MLDNIVKKWLYETTKGRVLFDHVLKNYTSFKIGGPAEAIVFSIDIEDLSKFVLIAIKFNVSITILGGGSNTLIRDRGIKGIVIIISGYKPTYNFFRKKNNLFRMKISSGVSLKNICTFSIRNGFSNMNFAIGIPGTIGGAAITNAGTNKGSVYNVLHSITVIDKYGKIKKITKPFKKIPYKIKLKDEIIIECEIDLIYNKHKIIRQEAKNIIIKRKNTQPINSANAGCFFKNPKNTLSAGEIIDKAGLKGVKIGDAMISNIHANFIINKNKATATDVLKLADFVNKLVYKRFKIILEPEVHVIGS